jgi:transposase
VNPATTPVCPSLASVTSDAGASAGQPCLHTPTPTGTGTGTGTDTGTGTGTPAALRLRCVNRQEVIDVPARLEDLLPAEHEARQLWNLVEQLDLGAFYRAVQVVQGERGRAAIDPKLLVALWLYATLQGVVEARVLARLCVEHLAYIWLCGGVTVSYHTLSDFRVAHEEALDALLTQVVRAMAAEGWVSFECLTQDGLRVRASAGAASFRREPTLQKHLEQAQAHLAAQTGQTTLAPQPEAAGAAERRTRAQQAAQERAARERVERLQEALRQLPELRAIRPASKRDDTRLSATDPDARKMKMADGGFRAATNWQVVCDALCGVIVDIDVNNVGSDRALMGPAVRRILRRYQLLPDCYEVDGGFVNLQTFADWGDKMLILAPPPDHQNGRDLYAPLPDDAPVIAEWRQRMGTEDGKQIYQLRAANSEWANALARGQFGVQQVVVRGLAKVRCLALWVALAHNLKIWLRRRQQPAPALLADLALARAEAETEEVRAA